MPPVPRIGPFADPMRGFPATEESVGQLTRPDMMPLNALTPTPPWADVPTNGTSPAGGPIAAKIALARQQGRAMYLPAGTYNCETGLTGSETSSVNIFGDGPKQTILLHNAGGVELFGGIGPSGSAQSLTASSTAGAQSVVIGGGVPADWGRGDWVQLKDTTQPIMGNSTRTQASVAGESARIRTIAGTTVTFYGRMDFAYPIGATATKITGIDGYHVARLQIKNPNPGTGPSNARGISVAYVRNMSVMGVDFVNMDEDCLRGQTVMDAQIIGCWFDDIRDLENPSLNPYAIAAANGSSNWQVLGCRARYCRHLFTTLSSSTEPGAANIQVAGCIATETTQAAFDVHPGARRITFDTCHVHNNSAQGFQIRGPDCNIINPIVNQATIGISVIYGADRCRISGGRLTGCDTGISIDSSDDCWVGGGIVIELPVTTGILVTRNANYAAFMSKVTLEDDITITGDPATATVQYDFWSHTGFKVGKIRTPNAAANKMVGRLFHTFASAASVTIPENSDVWAVSGATAITDIAVDNKWIGREVTLMFQTIGASVSDSGVMKLNGAFGPTTAVNSTLKLICSGALWHEVSRSLN